MSRRFTEPLILLLLVAAVLVWSGIAPIDRMTWCLEVAPVLIATPILLLTARRFPLTPLAYRLIFLHALLLIFGGHYTYEKVPLGDWARERFGMVRNNYDRLGHFVQGFVPAILAREIFVRRSVVRGGWLFFLTTAVCLAISAAFELIEWAAATAFGASADAYLATQGDPWDTQWDMFLALIGSVTAQSLLGHRHDRELQAAAGGRGNG